MRSAKHRSAISIDWGLREMGMQGNKSAPRPRMAGGMVSVVRQLPGIDPSTLINLIWSRRAPRLRLASLNAASSQPVIPRPSTDAGP